MYTNTRMENGGNQNHAISVYGGINEQTAQVGTGNMIATYGGSKKRKHVKKSKRRKSKGKKSKGGNLTRFAVPAVLLYANQLLGSKNASQRAFKSSKKIRGGYKKTNKNKSKKNVTFRA